MKVTRCVLPKKVLETMTRDAGRDAPEESGGILIGHFGADGVVITAASGPGPGARRARASFKRDGDHAQKVLDRMVSASGGHNDYVGEWHSHPADAGASLEDRRSMLRVSADPAYRRFHPVLVVLRRSNDGSWRVDAHQLARRRLTRLAVDVTEEHGC